MNNKIVFFGLAGTGTSSTGKKLAKELGFKFMSTGNIMRQKAEELGLSIYDFDTLCQQEPKYDLELDVMVKEYGKNNDKFIFESRLAWYFIPDAIKVYFSCDQNLAYARISKREHISITEATKLTKQRAKIIEGRYSILYPNMSYPPKKEVFDYIIDTTGKTIDESVKEIRIFLKNLNK
jgi:predicted cytidylate kinase